MDITKETIKINKIICEKKEQIVVQGDMIVPDSKPDILNTINTDGNICVYKKEVFEGKLRLEGNIVSYIMYLADGEKNNLRGLNTTLDFSEPLYVVSSSFEDVLELCVELLIFAFWFELFVDVLLFWFVVKFKSIP